VVTAVQPSTLTLVAGSEAGAAPADRRKPAVNLSQAESACA
jgi:hypothetical protein